MAMSDYEKIWDFTNLYKAHLKTRKGNSPEALRWELYLAENLCGLSRKLEQRTYRMHKYYRIVVREPKEREIFAAQYGDRVMLRCVCDEVLTPLLRRHLIYDNGACQKGKGTHFTLDRLTRFLQEHYRQYGNQGYALKCDISQYFASIDHQRLKDMLKRLVKDQDVRALLYHVIDSYETRDCPGRGLPTGLQSSQCFGLYYLDPVDRLVKEQMRVAHYVRYVDDFLLIHPDRSFLEGSLKQLREMLEEKLKLRLNPKTRIFSLAQGVEFLGWRFFLTDTGKVIRKLRSSSERRIRRRVKKLWTSYQRGEIARESVYAGLISIQGHLEHGHTCRLQEWLRPMLHQTAANDAISGPETHTRRSAF